MNQVLLQCSVFTFPVLLLVVLAGVLPQSCGGSSGGSTSGPTDFTLAVQQTRLFHFTWPDASDETEYFLWKIQMAARATTPK